LQIDHIFLLKMHY